MREAGEIDQGTVKSRENKDNDLKVVIGVEKRKLVEEILKRGQISRTQ